MQTSTREVEQARFGGEECEAGVEREKQRPCTHKLKECPSDTNIIIGKIQK